MQIKRFAHPSEKQRTFNRWLYLKVSNHSIMTVDIHVPLLIIMTLDDIIFTFQEQNAYAAVRSEESRRLGQPRVLF